MVRLTRQSSVAPVVVEEDDRPSLAARHKRSVRASLTRGNELVERIEDLIGRPVKRESAFGIPVIDRLNELRDRDLGFAALALSFSTSVYEARVDNVGDRVNRALGKIGRAAFQVELADEETENAEEAHTMSNGSAIRERKSRRQRRRKANELSSTLISLDDEAKIRRKDPVFRERLDPYFIEMSKRFDSLGAEGLLLATLPLRIHRRPQEALLPLSPSKEDSRGEAENICKVEVKVKRKRSESPSLRPKSREKKRTRQSTSAIMENDGFTTPPPSSCRPTSRGRKTFESSDCVMMQQSVNKATDLMMTDEEEGDEENQRMRDQTDGAKTEDEDEKRLSGGCQRRVAFLSFFLDGSLVSFPESTKNDHTMMHSSRENLNTNVLKDIMSEETSETIESLLEGPLCPPLQALRLALHPTEDLEEEEKDDYPEDNLDEVVARPDVHEKPTVEEEEVVGSLTPSRDDPPSHDSPAIQEIPHLQFDIQSLSELIRRGSQGAHHAKLNSVLVDPRKRRREGEPAVKTESSQTTDISIVDSVVQRTKQSRAATAKISEIRLGDSASGFDLPMLEKTSAANIPKYNTPIVTKSKGDWMTTPTFQSIVILFQPLSLLTLGTFLRPSDQRYGPQQAWRSRNFQTSKEEVLSLEGEEEREHRQPLQNNARDDPLDFGVQYMCEQDHLHTWGQEIMETPPVHISPTGVSAQQAALRCKAASGGFLDVQQVKSTMRSLLGEPRTLSDFLKQTRVNLTSHQEGSSSTISSSRLFVIALHICNETNVCLKESKENSQAPPKLVIGFCPQDDHY